MEIQLDYNDKTEKRKVIFVLSLLWTIPLIFLFFYASQYLLSNESIKQIESESIHRLNQTKINKIALDKIPYKETKPPTTLITTTQQPTLSPTNSTSPTTTLRTTVTATITSESKTTASTNTTTLATTPSPTQDKEYQFHLFNGTQTDCSIINSYLNDFNASSVIPKQVWQTWKTHAVHSGIKSMKSRNSNYQFNLLNDTETDDFMLYNLSWPQVTKSYFCIDQRMGAAKADIWRYAILWKYGGVYIDYDAGCNKPFNQFILSNKHYSAIISFGGWGGMGSCGSDNILQCVDKNKIDGIGVAQYVLMFAPKHPFLTHTLNIISGNIDFVKYHSNVTYINNSIYDLGKWSVDAATGPMIMTWAIYDLLETAKKCNIDIPYHVLPTEWTRNGCTFKVRQDTILSREYSEKHTHWNQHKHFKWINPSNQYCL